MKHHLKHIGTHCGLQGIIHGSFISWWASGKISSLKGVQLLQWGIDNIHLMTEEVSSQEIALGLLGLIPGVFIAHKKDWLKF